MRIPLRNYSIPSSSHIRLSTVWDSVKKLPRSLLSMGDGYASSPRSLETLAPELLSRIALFTLNDNFIVGPPSQVLPLTLTSRSISRALSLNDNFPLLSRIFGLKFDLVASKRRLGNKCLTTVHFAAELKKRCKALKRLKAGCLDDDTLFDDLWTAFLMMLENDGYNERHLLDWVDLHTCLFKIFRNLQARKDLDETPVWSLTIWLIWLTSNETSLRAELPADRDILLSALQPLVIAGYRRATSYGCEASFRHENFHLVSMSSLSYPSLLSASARESVHLAAPSAGRISHYHRVLSVCVPPAIFAAFLVTTVRLDFDQRCRRTTVGCSLSLPRDRETAIALGLTGPTIEDMKELTRATRVKPRPRLSKGKAARVHDIGISASDLFDSDWLRVTLCQDVSPSSSQALPFRKSVYVPGQLAGLWAGKLMVPELQAYRALLDDVPTSQPSRIPMYQRPLYMRLREHHSFVTEACVPCGSECGEDYDFLNAWLPRNCSYYEDEEKAQLAVFDQSSRSSIKYETFIPNSGFEEKSHYPSLNEERAAQIKSFINHSNKGSDNNPKLINGVKDIIVIGETDQRHGEAWGHFKVLGRVRPWDGLVALRRSPANPDETELGIWLFRGYILASGMLVGRWRETTTGIGVPVLEGPFVMTKQ